MRRAALLLLTAVVAAAPETERAAVAARKARRVRVAEEIGEGYALVIGQPPTEVLHVGQHIACRNDDLGPFARKPRINIRICAAQLFVADIVTPC